MRDAAPGISRWRGNPYGSPTPARRTMFDGAVRKGAEGILVQVDVRAGAAATRVAGYRPARRDIRIDVAARAEKGEANRALAAFLAKLVGVPDVAIVRGARSRRKTVLIRGASRDAVAAAMARGGP